uniref:Centrosomal protein kizuna n=1 Tax=Spermophilus dauricus TaxID=99837 RepID=A0A8C9QL76_SPEDA
MSGGSMHQAPASSAPLASPDYYERVGHLQHGLRDSEKKRLDLEKKLCEYNQSDICRVKLKYVKLKKYLKEICESEKKARTRNQEYLKRFECAKAHVGHFTTNIEKLQELKVAVQARINLGTTVSKGLYQPATMFMGRQMSAVSSLGAFSIDSVTYYKWGRTLYTACLPIPPRHPQNFQLRCDAGHFSPQSS